MCSNTTCKFLNPVTHFAGTNPLRRTQGGGGYGQNLASWGSTGDISDLQNKCGAQSITNQWYNSEMDNWSYYGQENPPSTLGLDLYGHFTQVVWKDTTKIGCATVLCTAGKMYDFDAWYTVCNYKNQGKSWIESQIRTKANEIRQLRWRVRQECSAAPRREDGCRLSKGPLGHSPLSGTGMVPNSRLRTGLVKLVAMAYPFGWATCSRLLVQKS